MEEREKRLEVWKHGMDHASLLSMFNPNLAPSSKYVCEMSYMRHGSTNNPLPGLPCREIKEISLCGLSERDVGD